MASAVSEGIIEADDIDEDLLRQALDVPNYVDLLIRFVILSSKVDN